MTNEYTVSVYPDVRTIPQQCGKMRSRTHFTLLITKEFVYIRAWVLQQENPRAKAEKTNEHYLISLLHNGKTSLEVQ